MFSAVSSILVMWSVLELDLWRMTAFSAEAHSRQSDESSGVRRRARSSSSTAASQSASERRCSNTEALARSGSTVGTLARSKKAPRRPREGLTIGGTVERSRGRISQDMVRLWVHSQTQPHSTRNHRNSVLYSQVGLFLRGVTEKRKKRNRRRRRRKRLQAP